MKRITAALFWLVSVTLMLASTVGAVSAMTVVTLSSQPDFTGLILPALIVGFIISLVFVLVEKSKMTTVKPSKEAAQYIVRGSLRLTVSHDRYLYKNVTRRPRNTDKKN